MMQIAFDVIHHLAGKTLATAESITGGGIGAVLTAVPGASSVYKGGIISYTDEVKNGVLGVPSNCLTDFGAVSAPVAEAMVLGVKKVLHTDVAVSVTGLAGPDGDHYGNPVGTVYIGYADDRCAFVREYQFSGDRDAVRTQTIQTALQLILENS